MTWLSVLDAATGAVLLVAGGVTWMGRRRSRVGALLVLAGLCWFAGSVVGVLAFVHRGPLVHVHVSYPTGRIHRRPAAWVVGLAWVAGFAEGIRAVPWLTLALSLLVAAAALDIFARSSGNARKAGIPALAAALLFAGVLAAGALNRLLDLHHDLAIAITYDVAVLAVVTWLTVDLLAGRWTDATVADLVTQLGAEPDATGVQAALRRALGDPGLVLGYRDHRADDFVDEHGRPLDVEPAPGQVATFVEDSGFPVAVMLHAQAVLGEPELLSAATSAVRLAVGNAALRTEIDQRMTALASARRGLVEAADAQRLALTARLQEGPERHLARLDDLLGDLDATELRADLAIARDELRNLVQGVRPEQLAEHGLEGALPVLAARSPVPVHLDLRVGRLPPTTESALYFVGAEALTNVAKHAAATTVTVSAEEVDGNVVLAVADDGLGGGDPRGSGLRGLADRIEALGGELHVQSPPGAGTVVTAVVPLAGWTHP